MSKPLNALMEFDHVIRVHPGGRIEPSNVYAPSVDVGTDEDGQISREDDAAMIETLRQEGWEILNGWSGQYGYSGPIMHPSEYIGGGLEDYIRQTPGYYAAVTVETLDDDEEAAGWAVVYRETTEN